MTTKTITVPRGVGHKQIQRFLELNPDMMPSGSYILSDEPRFNPPSDKQRKAIKAIVDLYGVMLEPEYAHTSDGKWQMSYCKRVCLAGNLIAILETLCAKQSINMAKGDHTIVFWRES